ncbi:MAG: arginine deiminase family protein [Thermoanaerobaculia bacterium]
MLAITRAVPASLVDCELTHLARVPIDIARAASQHEGYEAALRSLGCRIERLAKTPDLPDSVFVEDTAVVVDEIAVLTRPGAKSRRAEVPSVAQALAPYRDLAFIIPPGTLDGGDVLALGRRFYVGLSQRTNIEGVEQLRAVLSPFGYSVEALVVEGCLHLKSAVTALDEETVLLNPEWIDGSALAARRRIAIAPGEPFAANALAIGGTALLNATAPLTAAIVAAAGFTVLAVDQSELAKAESGLTCCSLLLND